MFIINDDTNEDVLFPKTRMTGLDLSGRDPEAKYAYGSTAPAAGADLLIPTSEWRGRIEEMKQRKSMLSDFIKAAKIKVKNQGQTNFCWANAPCTAVEVARAQQGQKYVELSPASVACKINGFRNEGGWGKNALEYLIRNGAVPSSMWPSNAIDRRFDTTANQSTAKKYRAVEWNELPVRDLGWLGSMLLRRIPVAVGYNWWGHEVLAVDIDWIGGEYVVRILNSWGDDWGDGGFAELQGNKMLPDDAVAPRTAIAA